MVLLVMFLSLSQSVLALGKMWLGCNSCAFYSEASIYIWIQALARTTEMRHV